eukprot:TRINITY_DN26442_c0_g4_i1.p1 TRINITY_DN26442_c0_g4~~TRINITY_DN26442_c0_g4_i1.p1  ORF type:complete len:163 (-),score=19.40 TRINITY_DN26442_c0_g4_i1:37-525(-)
MTSKTFPAAAAAELGFSPFPCIPTMHGFIHFPTSHDVIVESQMRRCESCPPDVALFAGAFQVSAMSPHQEPSHVATTSKQQAHDEGTCRPCAYFLSKEDGCRHGADCHFCHLCPPDELKRRKKEKHKRMKAELATGWSSASSSRAETRSSRWSRSFQTFSYA